MSHLPVTDAEPSRALYRCIPAIEQLLRHPQIQPLLAHYGNTLITEQLRQLQQLARQHIQTRHSLPNWSDDWPQALQHALQQRRLAPPRVFNLTGTVLHTNLGRSPMAEAAVTAVSQVMRHPAALEFDLDASARGHRDQQVAQLLCRLTGAEDACIVNNNAAAVLLLLASMAAGQEVVVSRGELVEIGGAFRVPDVMRQAGCLLHEVGTTNRTHLRDYEQAINPHTGLLMKVHTSNYSIQGFTAEVSHAELAALGQQHGLPTAVDLGSGSLIDLTAYGLPAEPMPQTLIAQGISLVSFSGDKLLGGPQAGIIIGKRDLIAQLQRHPLKRALRADKMTLAALEATLNLYLQPEHLRRDLPALHLLTREQSQMRAAAERLMPILQPLLADSFAIASAACASQIGSGSQPLDRLPSWALTFTPHDGRGTTLLTLADQWRRLPLPVIGRLQEGRLWLDLRCLWPDDEALFLSQLTERYAASQSKPVHPQSDTQSAPSAMTTVTATADKTLQGGALC